jgi:hypothetical protein
MSIDSHISAFLLLAACAASVPAQVVPATAPTSTAPAAPAAPSVAQTQQYLPAAAQPAERRAQVNMLPNGILTVNADNSSLNQILREISRVTGMKITGGVVDERVFGNYGPADPSTILTALLRGTGSNMMLIFNSHQAPAELVLTPRNGGPTPPSPNAGHERDEDDLPPRGMPHASRGPDPNDPRPRQPIQPQLPVPAQQPSAVEAPANSVPLPTPPPADTTTATSPNGVKTPQQIYDQLMQLQQQKQQQQQKTAPATPPQ